MLLSLNLNISFINIILGNANEDCYPQAETKVAKMGMWNYTIFADVVGDYTIFAALLFVCIFVFCCMVVLIFHLIDRRKKRGRVLTRSLERRLRDDKYALSAIGGDSVYTYFVTDSVFGWLAALVTIGTQIWILYVFIKVSEVNLQDDNIDIQFTWKCPRDTDMCKNKGDLDRTGWAIFGILMTAFLLKDLIGGSKLIYHSAKIRHSRKSRIRYFVGGMCLISITLFILYVRCCFSYGCNL